MQTGFASCERTRLLSKRIKNLMKKRLFDVVIATRFFNDDNSMYEKIFGWKRMKSEEDRTVPYGIAEYDKRYEEFKKSNKTLIDSTASCYNTIIDRAQTLLKTIHKVCKERNSSYPTALLGICFCGEISCYSEPYKAVVRSIENITEDDIEFFVYDSWAYGGYAEGYVTIPIALLDKDLDNPSWLIEMCDKVEQMKKNKRLKEERAQYEKLKAKFEGEG